MFALSQAFESSGNTVFEVSQALKSSGNTMFELSQALKSTGNTVFELRMDVKWSPMELKGVDPDIDQNRIRNGIKKLIQILLKIESEV